jgi:hypothetical protein
MQTDLKSLFAGNREVIEVAPKRGLGRPRKSREQAYEEPDVVLVAVENLAKQLEAYEVGLEYNPNSVKINGEKLYTEGTHFLGPGHYFIKFNRQ